MSEKLSLRWNDFHSNASKSFEIFRNKNYLHDVTLVSDDQNLVAAHKLVLSASSEYFDNIFKNNKMSNPFLCLEGISSTDLDNILDYIYNGEVQINQEHLDRFLAVAKRFKLEGLLDEEKEKEFEEKTINEPTTESPLRGIKSERVITEEPKTLQEDTPNQALPFDTSDLNELDQKLFKHMERDDKSGKYNCKMCTKTMMDRSNMKFHVESHIEGLSFPCISCGKDFRSGNAFKVHNTRYHRK